MLVREFREHDRKRLREIYVASRRLAFPWMDPARFVTADFETDTDGELILVAQIDETVIGFSSSWMPERFIHHLYLEDAFVGKGYGSRLLDATVERVGKPTRLKCLHRNVNAMRFYLKQGWSISAKGQCDDGEFLELSLP